MAGSSNRILRLLKKGYASIAGGLSTTFAPLFIGERPSKLEFKDDKVGYGNFATEDKELANKKYVDETVASPTMDVNMAGDLTVTGDLAVGDDVNITDDLDVGGTTRLDDLGVTTGVVAGLDGTYAKLGKQLIGDNSNLVLYNVDDKDDYFSITTGSSGITTIATIDSAAANADIQFNTDGDITFDLSSGLMKWYNPASDRYCQLEVASGGATTISTTDANAGTRSANFILDIDGHLKFDGCAAGFDQLALTYDASNADCAFRLGNKAIYVFGAGSTTNLRLYFPQVSGNFILLLKQDGTGSRTITNYKVYESDESAADGEAGVIFAGGSNPTLTTDANHVDILSFYWDATNEICYGTVASDFQF